MFQSKSKVTLPDGETLTLNKLSIRIFKAIQITMGDKVDHSHFLAAQYDKKLRDPFYLSYFIVSTGFMITDMRDEIYLQLLKQTSSNPSPRSTLTGWILLLLCCRYFLPNSEFLPMLQSYFDAGFHNSISNIVKLAKMCDQALKKVQVNHFNTSKPPSIEEVSKFMKERLTALHSGGLDIIVHLTDGSNVAYSIDISSNKTANDILQMVAKDKVILFM